MFSILLKKALPFTLTFALGAVLSGLAGPFGAAGERSEGGFVKHGRGHGRDHGRRACRMRAHKLVAESTTLDILFKPSVRNLRVATDSVRVNVTFGADGKVQKVEHLQPLLPESLLDEVERAARQIQFTPETINGVPVSIEKEVKIHVIPD